MLELHISGQELFDQKTGEFKNTDDIFLSLEHSLISLSKWEMKFQKPFLDTKEKSREETFAYIESMILTEDYPDDVCDFLNNEHLRQINEYIDSPSTATTFNEVGPRRKGPSSQIITSELVYYWMIAHSIPFECQYWHLNRLFALIRICNIKNDPDKKKMGRQELAARNQALNAQRKAALGTTG